MFGPGRSSLLLWYNVGQMLGNQRIKIFVMPKDLDLDTIKLGEIPSQQMTN